MLDAPITDGANLFWTIVIIGVAFVNGLGLMDQYMSNKKEKEESK
jgi:hypothetical protein